MSTPDLTRLRQRYAAESDEGIAHALSCGQSGYSSEDVWQLIVDEAQRRGMVLPTEPSEAVFSDPAVPGLLEQQPTLVAGSIALARVGLILVIILNVMAFVIAIVNGYGVAASLAGNLIVLGIVWLLLTFLHRAAVLRKNGRDGTWSYSRR